MDRRQLQRRRRERRLGNFHGSSVVFVGFMGCVSKNAIIGPWRAFTIHQNSTLSTYTSLLFRTMALCTVFGVWTSPLGESSVGSRAKRIYSFTARRPFSSSIEHLSPPISMRFNDSLHLAGYPGAPRHGLRPFYCTLGGLKHPKLVFSSCENSPPRTEIGLMPQSLTQNWTPVGTSFANFPPHLLLPDSGRVKGNFLARWVLVRGSGHLFLL